MARFECKIPFKKGETWCRRNFFSVDSRPIGEHPQIVGVSAPDLPVVVESAAKKTEAESGWGGMTPVVEVYLRLESQAPAAGTAVATIEVDLEGDLLSCADASDACEPGSSG